MQNLPKSGALIFREFGYPPCNFTFVGAARQPLCQRVSLFGQMEFNNASILRRVRPCHKTSLYQFFDKMTGRRLFDLQPVCQLIDSVRTSEMQVWFLSEHLVDVPLVEAGRIPGVMRTA